MPSCTLIGSHGKPILLSDVFCQHSISFLFLYPKDGSLLCTKQVNLLKGIYPLLQKYDATVVGISSDTPIRHAAFIEGHALPFLLLSDVEKTYLSKCHQTPFFSFLPPRTTYAVDRKGYILDICSSSLFLSHHIRMIRKVLSELT
ncbi:MAG: redoxin domain-containing protein [Cytophagales bacterium]|nr:redoxin domain-containing protein [Cytophagales bacterium]